jgi:molybdopterin/thiamine biosynthesis adenylyltransferase
MFSFTSSTIPNNIFVIGAGGTGSRLIPMLSQFIRSITRGKSPQGWIEDPTIWVIDDDTVELKNLVRQNFIEVDVGKPKAVVVAERYSRAYGVRIVPLVTRITSDNTQELYDSISAIKNSISINPAHLVDQAAFIITQSIVIICVDSTEARRDILNTFIVDPDKISSQVRPPNKTFFIDAGNEDSFGQVSFFTPDVLIDRIGYDNLPEHTKVPKLVPVVISSDIVPMDVDYYINLQDTESTASCADLNQTLAINALMATNIMGIVQNFFYRKPLRYNCIRTSLDGGNSTDYNTFHNFYRKTYDGYVNNISSEEKNGKKKKLVFINRVNLTNLKYLGNSIVKEINAIAKAAKDMEDARKKLIAIEESRIARELAMAKILKDAKEAIEANEALLAKDNEALLAKTQLAKANELIEKGLKAKKKSESEGIQALPPTLSALPRVRNTVTLDAPTLVVDLATAAEEIDAEYEETYYEEDYTDTY